MAILKSFGKACIIAFVIRLVERLIVSGPRLPVQRFLPFAGLSSRRRLMTFPLPSFVLPAAFFLLSGRTTRFVRLPDDSLRRLRLLAGWFNAVASCSSVCLPLHACCPLPWMLWFFSQGLTGLPRFLELFIRIPAIVSAIESCIAVIDATLSRSASAISGELPEHRQYYREYGRQPVGSSQWNGSVRSVPPILSEEGSFYFIPGFEIPSEHVPE